MRAVYRRSAGVWLALLAAAGCREEAPPPLPAHAPPARRSALATLLESFEVTPAPARGALPLAFGTSRAASGTTAVRLAGPEAIPGLPAPSETLVQLAADRALVRAGDRLWVVGPQATARPVPGIGSTPVRLLAVGDAFAWLAAADPDGERLLRADASGALQTVGNLPRGLVARVASADGERLALTRRESDGDQLFLHEPASGATRLLLPDDRPGRFEPMAFSADATRLLLVAGDGDGGASLEWLALGDGERLPIAVGGCEVTAARPRGDDALAVETSCRGRADLVLLEGGAERSLPTTADGRAVAAWPDGPSGWLYAVASPRHPRDLWRLDANGDARPLVYGLAPRVDPADLVAPAPVEVRSSAGALAAELWLPRETPGERAAGGVIWLDRDDLPPRWFEFDPVLQFLAQRGLAVLRFRAPVEPGDGVRAALDRALATLRERAALGAAPVALVGVGARSAAVVESVAGRTGVFAAVAALDVARDATLSRLDLGGTPLLRVAPPAPLAFAGAEIAEAAGASPPPSEAREARLAEAAALPAPLPSDVAAALWGHLAEHLARRPAGGPPKP